jgi:transcriptional regulator with PAS, ATPase and Fis domain
VTDHEVFWEVVGSSQKILALKKMVLRIAPTESTILIQGESGTGKELVARALHYNSKRRQKNFVSVNCGAFTATLLESELFGHVKGAFTGADRNKKGLVESAHAGTFFLDEIGEMPLELQVKLLRLLEEKEFIPVGANKAQKADVRFICATNRQLQEEVKAKRFREDLYYRLNVIPLFLPPLREREEDVLEIADFFLKLYGEKMGQKTKKLSPEVKEIFLSYSWPGNVRELENSIQRCLALGDSESLLLKTEDLEERILHASTDTSFLNLQIPEKGFDIKLHLEQLEAAFLRAALKQSSGNFEKAAKLLNLNLRQFQNRLDKLKIPAS